MVLFGTLAGIAIVWNIFTLFCCMFVRAPKSSAFPEINFASKCIQSPIKETIAELIYPLSNTHSDSVVEKLAKAKFFLDEGHREREGHVALLMEREM